MRIRWNVSCREGRISQRIVSKRASGNYYCRQQEGVKTSKRTNEDCFILPVRYFLNGHQTVENVMAWWRLIEGISRRGDKNEEEEDREPEDSVEM